VDIATGTSTVDTKHAPFRDADRDFLREIEIFGGGSRRARVEIDTHCVEGSASKGSFTIQPRRKLVRSPKDLDTRIAMSIAQLGAAADWPHRIDDQLRAVLDVIPALVWLAAPDGGVVYSSRRWLEYTGLPAEQAVGCAWTTVVHQEDINGLTAYWQTALDSGTPGELEVRLRRFDGQYRWFLFCATPLRDSSGMVTGWCGTNIDIDNQKRAEDLQRSRERHLSAILDNIPAMVAIHNVSGELELYNRAARDFHGPCVADPKQWKISDVVHPDDLPALLAARERAVQTGEPVETEPRLRRADGTYRWCHVRAVRCDDYDGTSRWYSVRTDIHDRKTAEDQLRRSEARLLEVQRLSRTGAWRYDLATDIVESSPEIQHVYEAQPGEDISHPPFWFDRIHPEDRPRVEAQFERSIREKTDYRAGYRILLPDGNIRYQYATGHPVTNDAGDVVEFVGASMDMTEHWQATAELERASQAVRDLQARISRAAQIATVGELAGSIAHEVNQPLAAVVANAHACLRWLSASPPNISKAMEASERIVKDGKDAGEVIRRVRSLFKRTAAEKVPLEFAEVIGEVFRLLDSYPARKDVSLSVELDRNLPPLFADRVQLQQLLLNLILNALEALEPVTGRVKQVAVRSKRADGNQCVIQISDNGIGFDNSIAAFEPFVTTKPEGMGLGLAICRSIVAAHDGQLTAERNVGFGTTFTVTLPIQSEASS